MAAVVYDMTEGFRAALRRERANVSPREATILFQALNDIARNPLLSGSQVSFHNPSDADARRYSRAPFEFLYPASDRGKGIVKFTHVYRPNRP